jgi:proton-coupled amino acid transporter
MSNILKIINNRASFGDTVQTALTASLPKGTLSSMVQFAYSIAVIFTFPLQAFPALEVVCNTTHTKAGRNKTSEAIIFRRNVTATIIVCLLGFVAEISTNYLGNVVSLIGSFVGIPIALIYPPLMHNKLVPESSVLTKVLNICLAVVGLFAAGAASYTTIVSWNEGAEG